MNKAIKRIILYVLAAIVCYLFVDISIIYKEKKYDTVVVVANGVPTFSSPSALLQTGLLEKGSRAIVIDHSAKNISSYIKREGLDYFIKVRVHEGKRSGEEVWLFGNDSEGLEVIHK